MMQSMTGYGQSRHQNGELQITVEIRSLNSKGLDLNLRLPSVYKDREMAWRKRVGEAAQRGKVEVNIYRERQNAMADTGLDKEWLQTAMSALEDVAGEPLPKSEALALAMRMNAPQRTQVIEDAEWNTVESCIDDALVAFEVFRLREGQTLADDLSEQLNAIQSRLDVIPSMEGERISRVKQRLQEALDGAGVEVNPERLEQELVLHLDKLDINEEKVRLAAHLDHFREAMTQAEGRKLGFIAQEIGREVNTLGSKANHAGMQREVVGMKEALDKIKEQVLNVR